jgi:hypothetical protein
MTRRGKDPGIGRGKVEAQREWLKKPAPPLPPKTTLLKIRQASRKRQSGGKVSIGAKPSGGTESVLALRRWSLMRRGHSLAAAHAAAVAMK